VTAPNVPRRPVKLPGSMHKDAVKRLRNLQRAGWTITNTGSGHLRLRHPLGGCVFAPRTASDHRAWLNVERDIRLLERKHAS
jgi:hypothetical protein